MAREEKPARTILLGAVSGALIGAVLGLLYYRARQRRGALPRRPVQARQIMRLGVTLAPALRQVLDLLS